MMKALPSELMKTPLPSIPLSHYPTRTNSASPAPSPTNGYRSRHFSPWGFATVH
ncbi:hypothetical protein BDZ91DRAFT_726121, partial [Kalaharituber pfeilii]